ncbi:PREDICTED: uncharacterized protein LOC109358812 [Lupinus angustifolius]|uniref:uncharacterized protein LOC109358812 n=1 Tax=Lupinus angustifolius TaxID=3871 RepID=UPI00092EC7FC|nr:PREDICTED: uncharacterized protein LOC109358812 [Lupinus angustifolius]
MPTDDNLQHIGKKLASKCNLCNSSQEDTSHLFFQCSFAQALWSWVQDAFSLRINTQSIQSILSSCICHSNNQLKELLLATIIITVATIWFCRNHRRFEDKHICINQAIAKIKTEITWVGNCSKVTSNSCTASDLLLLRTFKIQLKLNKAPKIVEVKWLMPCDGWIKVNTNGAAKGSPGLAGAGGIFRNINGSCVAYFASFLGIHSGVYAELFASIKVVQLAFNNGWTNIWLECDSTTVVDIFKGRAKAPWKISNLWDNCNSKLNSLNLHVSRIFREGNDFIRDDYNRNSLGLPSYRFNHM